jgi:hypothetical protein
MPITATLPVVVPDPTQTILGQRCIFAFLPTGGSQVNFRAKVAGYSRSISKLPRKVAGTNGRIKTDRTVVTEFAETAKLTFDEFSANLMTTFFNVAQASGTARIWILDPSDAATTASLMTGEFPCDCIIEGDTNFQMDQFSDTVLSVEASDIMGWTRDASVA